VAATPWGPPSECLWPPPGLTIEAACAWSRASVMLDRIAVTSLAFLWTSLRLMLAASWVLGWIWRSVRPLGRALLGFFRDDLVLALIVSAFTASLAVAWWIILAVLYPLCQEWRVGGASPMTRAVARPADLSHSASGQRAGPLTTAVMIFSKGFDAVMVVKPPLIQVG
jgi:hypothetical protein